MHKVLTAMSGGVDGSAAAAILLERGFNVSGATMKLFSNDCTDIEDARAAAAALDIEHMVFDFTELFESSVIDRFTALYLDGQTPNPCVLCNRAVKFGAFVRRAVELGFDYVATGHYVRLSHDAKSDEHLLHRAEDVSKDQSYVLYSLTQEVLSRTLFPLGDMKKSDAREIAARSGVKNVNRPESQDICFVRDGDYAGFIESVAGTGMGPGVFLDTGGNTIGAHRGIVHYTIGQRRGIGIAASHPLYVIDKDAAANTVTVGRNEALFSEKLTVRDVNIVSPRFLEPLGASFAATVKIRYAHGGSGARVTLLPGGRARVDFESPQRAVTRGQSAVFYNDGVLIGGGVIE